MSVLFKLNGIWKKVGENIIRHSEPVGVIRIHCGAVAPDGYMLCHGQILSANDYPELYDVVGTKFGTGDGSVGSFNLPDLQNKTTFGVGAATGGLSSIGASTVGSLPNITGSFHARGDDDAGSCGVVASGTSGAFYAPESGLVRVFGGIVLQGQPAYGSIDASRSSSMYKTTAQAVPASVGVEYIIKVIL